MWSLFNSGQLNQAAVQQLAQAVFGSANNVAVISQGNLNGAAPRVTVLLLCCSGLQYVVLRMLSCRLHRRLGAVAACRASGYKRWPGGPGDGADTCFGVLQWAASS